MYIISVLMAYFIAVIIRDTWGEDIQKWERKHDKHMIYILLSTIIIWPISFVILLIRAIASLIISFFVGICGIIKYIFNL